MDGNKLTEVVLDVPEYNLEKFFGFTSTRFKITAGIHEIRSIIRGATTRDSVHYKNWKFIDA